MNHRKENENLARQLRKNMTPWERKLWFLFLKDYPVRFQRQKCIDQYIVDFYCFQAKLVIELDGGGHYEPVKQEQDIMRTKQLENYGLKVIRFCNLDIDKNFYGVCTVIDNEVKQRILFSPPAPVGHPPHKCGGQGGRSKFLGGQQCLTKPK